MTTRQAVWPRELIERRATAAAVQAELRVAEQVRAADPDRMQRIAELQAVISRLPCPHWDMSLDPTHGTDWTCESCGTVIAPEWVPLGEQESHLRRLRGRSPLAASRF